MITSVCTKHHNFQNVVMYTIITIFFMKKVLLISEIYENNTMLIFYDYTCL